MILSKRPQRIILICILNLYFVITATAQIRHTREIKSDLIIDLCNKIKKYYFLSEKGTEISDFILKKYNNGLYTDEKEVDKLLEVLNNDLYNTSKDNHLKIFYSPEEAKELEDTTKRADNTESEQKIEKWLNYGVKEVKILDGEIGYLNFTDFCSLFYGSRIIDAAMSLLSGCKALIIDLRQNGGGLDEMVTYLTGYFVNSDASITTSISYSTISNEYYSSVIPGNVNGVKYLEKPVYILTSGVTASAAEGFTALMKYYNKNVIIVGRRTKGAQNPVTHIAVNNSFVLRIPSWRKVFSIFEMNWEWTGIKPDVETEFQKALSYAYIDALKKTDTSKDNTEKFLYQWAVDKAESLNREQNIKEDILKSYAGRYGKIDIKYKDGSLFYGDDGLLMVPLTENYFIIDSADYLRVKFIVENKNVSAIERILVYGTTARISKNIN